ncbi:hypothetical protein [uncultured Campylobacter sp.]|nr:hypothetical protein [uncultured Campylobacter sp.]
MIYAEMMDWLAEFIGWNLSVGIYRLEFIGWNLSVPRGESS